MVEFSALHTFKHPHSLKMSLLRLQLHLHGLCYMGPHTCTSLHTPQPRSLLQQEPVIQCLVRSYTWRTYSRQLLPAIQSLDQFYIQHRPALPTVHKMLLAIQRLEHFYVTYIATHSSPRELAIQCLGPQENYIHIHVLSFIHSRSTTLHSQAYIYTD